jgi:hypothetical protein
MSELATRKSYTKPEIVHEMDLETRAGSPLTPPELDPVDPTNASSN